MKIKNPQQFQSDLAAWFRVHARDLPWRQTRDPYAIMVSEFMLQQTQVATVQPYFTRWMERFPDVQSLAAAEEAEVLAMWQGLGYYRRARNLHRAARQVMSEHEGRLPADAEALAKLPGVGRYTAGAIACFAFDLRAPAIDANIARVLSRLLDLRDAIDAQPGIGMLWQAAERLLPPTGAGLHTSALMELGALVCTPAKPRCLACPVQPACRTRDPESLPVKKPRRATASLREDCAWVVRDRRRMVLLEQQTGPRWTGLWKLPALHPPPAGIAPLTVLTYPFTHHRVELSVYPAPTPLRLAPNQQWFYFAELGAVAVPSPHRRALEQIRAQGAKPASA